MGIFEKTSELCYPTLRRCADFGLAYLIRLSGYNNVTTVVHKKEIMEDIFLLMNKIEARAIGSFCLSLSKINIPNVNYEEAEQVANPITSTTMDEKTKAELERFF